MAQRVRRYSNWLDANPSSLSRLFHGVFPADGARGSG